MVDRPERLKHFNANHYCHNPFEIHTNPNRKYSGKTVSQTYADLHRNVGLYKGQTICRKCEMHIGSLKRKADEMLNEPPPLEMPPPLPSCDNASEKVDKDISMLELELLHEQLLSVKEQMKKINQSRTSNSHQLSSKIFKEVRFNFHSKTMAKIVLLKINVRCRKKILSYRRSESVIPYLTCSMVL